MKINERRGDLPLAKEYGLTLIGNLKHGKMRIYS